MSEGMKGIRIAPVTVEDVAEAPEHARAGARRGELVRRRLIVADAVGLALAFLVAELLFGRTVPADRLSLTSEYLLFVLTLPGWVAVAKLYRLYDNDDERADHSTIDDLVGVFHLATVGAWLVFVAAWASSAASPGMTKLVTFWALAVVLVTGGRAITRSAVRRQLDYVQKTIIVGAGDVGQLIARKFAQHQEYGIEVVGLVDAAPKDLRSDLGALPVLGTPDELAALIEAHDVERVVIAFSNDEHKRTLSLVRELEKLDVQIDIVPRLFEVVGPHVKVHKVEGIALVALPAAKRFPASRQLKRGMDIVLASLALLLASPIFAYVAWRIRRDSPGPVFFRQG